MALINCPNCGSTISDTANHCPKCGVQLKGSTPKNKNKTSLYALFAVLGALVIIIGGTIAYSDYAEKKEKREALIQEEQAKVAAKQERDSLDRVLWEKTMEKNDEQAYQLYLQKFPDGKHAEQAKKHLDYAEKMKLTSEEEYGASECISSFFRCLANGYEDDMLVYLNPNLSTFLGKKNATKVDAIAYMKKIHSDDVYSVDITMGDIEVKKSLVDNEEPIYTATFTYDQRLEREDTSLETFASMKGTATLNKNYKITSLSLSKTATY
ncbi:MAG: zinc ribbon domain-containing protein [Prevotella sp.]|nr:zinc ribbon domain-containing protein [Prevotella sp.]